MLLLCSRINRRIAANSRDIRTEGNETKRRKSNERKLANLIGKLACAVWYCRSDATRRAVKLRDTRRPCSTVATVEKVTLPHPRDPACCIRFICCARHHRTHAIRRFDAIADSDDLWLLILMPWSLRHGAHEEKFRVVNVD